LRSLCLPLLKTGGLAILYRGHWTDDETEALTLVIEELGGAIESIESFTTPISNSVRHCLYLRSYSPPKELPIIKKDRKRK
jgi:16S rRNA (guanine527-N7)-methyltransferase